MKKNFKILKALVRKRMHQSDLVVNGVVSSDSRCSRIINMRSAPTSKEVEKLSKFLGISKSDVVTGGNDE